MAIKKKNKIKLGPNVKHHRKNISYAHEEKVVKRSFKCERQPKKEERFSGSIFRFHLVMVNGAVDDDCDGVMVISLLFSSNSPL